MTDVIHPRATAVAVISAISTNLLFQQLLHDLAFQRCRSHRRRPLVVILRPTTPCRNLLQPANLHRKLLLLFESKQLVTTST